MGSKILGLLPVFISAIILEILSFFIYTMGNVKRCTFPCLGIKKKNKKKHHICAQVGSTKEMLVIFTKHLFTLSR